MLCLSGARNKPKRPARSALPRTLTTRQANSEQSAKPHCAHSDPRQGARCSVLIAAAQAAQAHPPLTSERETKQLTQRKQKGESGRQRGKEKGTEGREDREEGGEGERRRERGGGRRRRDGLRQRACPTPAAARLRSTEALSPTVHQEDTRSPGEDRASLS